jgi:hypothetical protein
MKFLLAVPLAAWLTLAVAPAYAVDLATVERTIAKEPAYQSSHATYCLLVFGPEAKRRVWLVLDGDVLYVDRNGNGDLTETGEKVKAENRTTFPIGELFAGEGKAKCTEVKLRTGGGNNPCAVSMTIDGKDWTASCRFAARPQDAPILHFNGPLVLRPEPPPQLTRGSKKSTLTVNLGTPGLGTGSFATVRAKQAVPKSASLVADIEFPSKTSGGETIKTQLVLPPPGG